MTLSSKNVLEELVLSSLRASPLMKPLFTPGGWQVEKWVHWNVSVGLKWVRTSSTPLISKSFTFVNSSVQKVCFCFEYFSCRLDSLMLFVSLFDELCDLFSGYLSHENIGESNCHFGARGSPTYLYVVFPVTWKEFSARISLSALCSSRVGIGGSVFLCLF